MTKPLTFTGTFKLSRAEKKCLMSKFHCLNAGIKTVWCKKTS